MALITRTIPSLMNGVSQQPPLLRSTDQTEDELNTWSHIADGVGRRPPTQTIAKLSGLVSGVDYSIHHINRDINERYLVIVKNGDIMVFDETTGEAKTVNAPVGWGYLDADGDVYRAVSIADYTFIVNTTKTVEMRGVGADQVAPPATYRLPGGTSPQNTTGATNGVPGVTYNGMLAQYRPNPTYSAGLTGTVPSMDKLPDPPCSGCVYKVLGQNDTAFVSFYVQGDGTVWNETVAPGLNNAIDETTMPWALIREADGTFTFTPFSWKPRAVGDASTNPYPPFISRTIKDVFFYQNRLGFAVDDGVVFTAAGDYGDFWRRTVLDYVDSDPIAANVAVTDVALIDFALPFADGVMLFSRQHQFSLTNAAQGLSANSIAITPVTKYVMAEGVRPTPMGSQAHFLSEARGFVAVQEYTRLSGSDPTEASDITAHVPHLIPKGASQIIPFPDLNALMVLIHDSATPSKAFVYQFYWDGDKKLVSAWRPWDFGDGVPVTGAYESGSLLLVMQRPDGFFLEKMDLSPEALSENQDHVIFLDRQQSVTGTYDATHETTSFTVDFTPDITKLHVVTGNSFENAESSLDGLTVSGLTIKVPGDYSTGPVTIGHAYTTKVVPTRQFPLDWQNRPLTTGRLVLHTFTANLAETAYLRAEVYPYGAAAAALQDGLMSSVEFTPQILGGPYVASDTRFYVTDSFTFSVAGDASLARIELINDGPFGSTITSAQWEALFFNRAIAG